MTFNEADSEVRSSFLETLKKRRNKNLTIEGEKLHKWSNAFIA